MQWNAAVTIVYQHENHFLILAIKSCVFSVSCLVSELVSMPDSQMNQSFGKTDFQKGMILFTTQFDSFGQFTHRLNPL